ncbi:hypothetical protein RclHR1_02020010 [Rhizophagus clarus]|uniref:Uncharacterized protein n=1 Tax=Rhizophagus clarus TaxID=94130 RepID=A0A2Z6RJC5_9GLOM|nr:hypothetical protein RclHR1_02020010 [Rhizophagus clarus]
MTTVVKHGFKLQLCWSDIPCCNISQDSLLLHNQRRCQPSCRFPSVTDKKSRIDALDVLDTSRKGNEYIGEINSPAESAE